MFIACIYGTPAMEDELTELPIDLAHDIDEVLKKHLSHLNHQDQFSQMFKAIVALSFYMIETIFQGNHLAKIFVMEELHKAIKYHVTKADKSLN
jgi:hypothetical protein